MPSYTTTTAIENILPSSLPAAITAADKTAWVEDASAIVDSSVGPKFPMLSTNQKFADSTSSPALIELCTRWLGAYFGFLRLREISTSDSEPKQAGKYYKLAMDTLKAIREGKLDIYDAAGADLASAEQAYITNEGRDPTFNTGVYIDGVIDGDSGSLDDFAYGKA